MRFRSKLRRLELACERLWPDELTDEQRRRRVIELLRTAYERRLAVDAALASRDPRR